MLPYHPLPARARYQFFIPRTIRATYALFLFCFFLAFVVIWILPALLMDLWHTPPSRATVQKNLPSLIVLLLIVTGLRDSWKTLKKSHILAFDSGRRRFACCHWQRLRWRAAEEYPADNFLGITIRAEKRIFSLWLIGKNNQENILIEQAGNLFLTAPRHLQKTAARIAYVSGLPLLAQHYSYKK